MKNLFTNVFLVLILGAFIFLSSCSETDPLPVSKADFKITSIAPEIDVPVQFENLSLNASSFVWDYGDGFKDSLVIDPSHVYSEPGDYVVMMTAYTEDGQTSESFQDIDVGQRYLTAMYLLNINMVDSLGNPWDDDGSGPDVTYVLIPLDNQTQDVVGFSIDSLNVGEFSTPMWITDEDLIPQNYELTNSIYRLWLLEFNTEDEEAEPREMARVEFNPVVPEDFITDIKREDGTGELAIPFIVLDEYQFFLEYEIRK